MSKLKIFLHNLFHVYCREFKLVKNDIGLLLFFLFLPMAYPVVYSLIYNPELVRNVRAVVVDNDRSSLSRELVRNLDATQEMWVTGYAADMHEARRAMNSHDCYAIVEIPEGFGRKVGSGEQGNVTVFCESSLLLRYRGFLMASTNVAQAMGAELMTEKIDNVAPVAETLMTGDLLPVQSIAMGNTTSGFDSFIMPGVLILILQQSIILALGMAGGAKRERPSLIGYRGVNAVRSVATTMLGQLLCYATILVVPILFLVHYVPLIFQFPMVNAGIEVLALLIPLTLASYGMGFCLQGIVWERETVFVLWVVTSVIFLFLSGLTWPRFAMAPFWHFVSDCVPATWGVNAFIKMHTNGASLAQVRGEYVALWILAGVYLLAGYCVQRWVVRPSIEDRSFSYGSVRRRSF